MRQAVGDRAVAARRITQGLRDMPRLLGRIDMPHDNPEPAAIEKARRQLQLPRRHPRHRRDARTKRGNCDLHRSGKVH